MSLAKVVRRLYRGLARALPDQFQQTYGSALVDTADETVEAMSRRGSRGLLLALPGLMSDLIVRLITEHARDAARDTRYAVRALLRAPGFSLAAVICLAIGIGLTGAMYSQIQSTVFRAIPGVGTPAEVVRLQQPLSFVYFEALREAGHPFAEVAAYMAPVPMVLSQTGLASERVWAHVTTPDYFEVLETPLALGTTLHSTQDASGAIGVVLSHRLWQTRFGGDPAIVGRAIRLNSQTMTIAGIAPSGFLGASPTTSAADLWVSTTSPRFVAPELGQLYEPHVPAFDVIGRLAPGVSMRQAESALEPVVRRLEQLYNDPRRDRPEARVRLLPGGRMLAIRNEDVPRAIGFPVVLVSLVLLMACGNVANMLLARSATRRREIAVRLSLGAGPGRVLRQLLTESLVLTMVGAAAGGLVATGLLMFFDSLRPMLPDYGHFEVRFDWPSFTGATLLAATFVLLFGLAPARRAGREDISLALKPNASPSGRRRSWASLQHLLVFQQVAASVMLLLLTSFIVLGWQRTANVDPGFDPSGLYLVRLDPVRDGTPPDEARRFFEQLSARLRATPNVTNVSVAQTLPAALASGEAMLAAKVDVAGGSQSLGAIRTDYVGARFFETIGAPITRGRDFTSRDEQSGAQLAIVSTTMASRTWPNQDPIGRVIDLDGEAVEIVGVVGDLQSAFPLAPMPPVVYRPLGETTFARPSTHGVVVVARVRPGGDAPSLLRREIETLDASITVFEVTRVTDELADARFLASFATLIYGGMGVFGLALASVGLAGVTAHAVARRRREIGIRMALGAGRGRVLWLVLRESTAIIAVGTVTGLVLALAVTRVLASVLEPLAETTRTSLTDPLIVAGGPLLLAMLALLACYLPARQSTRINPTTALRAE